MSVQSFAAITTRCAANATTTIQSGETVRIYGYVLSGAGAYTFSNAAGTTLFVITTSAATTTLVNPIPWFADAGLQVAVPASCEAVVHHSQGGA